MTTSQLDLLQMLLAMSSSAILFALLLRIVPTLLDAGWNILFYIRQSIHEIIFSLPSRKNVWGTVYDSDTKRPIPFARISLFDTGNRLLEARVADSRGRYGFLTTPESLMKERINVRILPDKRGYHFPSRDETTTDSFLYGNLYFGDVISAGEHLLNFDIPMEPLVRRNASLLQKGPAIEIETLVAAIADFSFWAGLIVVPLNALLSPNPFTIGVVFLFFGTASLRIWGVMDQPFGIVTDERTGRPIPFVLITLNDLSEKRVAFTVADELGRYVLVTEKGTYQLTLHTPASVQPRRTSRTIIKTTKGWITRPLTL